jgi:hypothetical protein
MFGVRSATPVRFWSSGQVWVVGSATPVRLWSSGQVWVIGCGLSVVGCRFRHGGQVWRNCSKLRPFTPIP